MVKFELFGKFKKKPSLPLTRYVEVAKKMMETGKTQAEVASFLKSQGLSYEQIDVIMRQVIRSAALKKNEISHQQPSQKPIMQMQTRSPSNLNSTPIPSQPSLPNVNKVQPTLLTQPSTPDYHESPTQYNEAEQINKDDEFLMELEEIIDLILKNKYGDISSMKKEMEELKKKLKSSISSIETRLQEINKRIEEIDAKRTSDNNELNKKLNDIVPRLAALESAFKDNIPVMLDELRKIEEHLELRDKVTNKPKEVVANENGSEEKKRKSDIDLVELIKGE